MKRFMKKLERGKGKSVRDLVSERQERQKKQLYEYVAANQVEGGEKAPDVQETPPTEN